MDTTYSNYANNYQNILTEFNMITKVNVSEFNNTLVVSGMLDNEEIHKLYSFQHAKVAKAVANKVSMFIGVK